MKFDGYNYIEMEQNKFPGSIGDSAAETGRCITIAHVLGKDLNIDLSNFITKDGILRHPSSPWREDDTSGDQVAPLLVAAALTQEEVADDILEKLDNNRGRTGNGDLISPGLWATIRRYKNKSFLWISDVTILGQALLMKFPYRWNDGFKRIERTEDSSADYLNFFNAIAYAHCCENKTITLWLATKIISAEKLLERVKHYYQPEPNSEWLIKLYEKAIAKVW